MRSVVIAASLVIGICFSAAVTAAEDVPIAGVEPSHRPLGAPTIETFEKTSDWYANALTGVSEPYPQSLHFLEDQGAWFTPFNRPGMTGPYDIRHWHQSD